MFIGAIETYRLLLQARCAREEPGCGVFIEDPGRTVADDMHCTQNSFTNNVKTSLLFTLQFAQ
jgi:hypothetical protein